MPTPKQEDLAMPRGISVKREREFKQLTSKFKSEHRYAGREEEVAARIVNKQRHEYGETKEEKQKDRAGLSPARHLPLAEYDRLTIPRIRSQLDRLDPRALRMLRTYERGHKQRKGVLAELERRLSHH
jgi:hypothetical protein